LGSEAVSPDRHFTGAVAANFFSTFDRAVNLPKGKAAAIILRQSGQVGRRNREISPHYPIASRIDAMANGARIQVLELACGGNFHFLRHQRLNKAWES
jgi:hypothetical protein